MILIGLEGELQVKYARHAYSLKKGETMLIPACLDTIELLVDQQCKVLETFVPPNKVNR
jgi:mannose-6-phosphate isomerase class I